METEAERNARLYRETEAKRISDQIDEDLRQERERLKRKKGDVKVSLDQLCHNYDAYIDRLHPYPAIIAWSGRKWKINSAKAVSTHVQAEYY